MKRIAMIAAALLLLTAAGALALGLARPDLLPDWARPAPAQSDAPATADSGLFCDEHGVPEKFCTICHPELAETLLLCPEHGQIPEDVCTLCHPDVEAKLGLAMCPKGHGLPAFFCHVCGTAPPAAEGPDDGWCAEHNEPEATCARCLAARSPADGSSRDCQKTLPMVRLAKAELARRIGLETAEAVAERHGHRLVANAETAFDSNRYAEVSPRVGGFLAEVRADLGRVVARGEVLAVVDSAEVSALKARYLAYRGALTLAKANYERTLKLVERKAAPATQELESLVALNQADSQRLEAERALRNLGADDEALARIISEKDTSSLVEVVAPLAGTVVARHAVRGEAVEASAKLFAVADTTAMWLWIDVDEADIGSVAEGQAVAFAISGSKLPPFEGRVTWTGAEVDSTTRTSRIRAELPNPGGRLRANQFGTAEIAVGDEHEVVVVPRAAVQENEGAGVVFLPDGPGTYRPQRVVTRPTDRREVLEVSWGLKPGDRVVTKGSFLLKTEIMKGAIGAGCCE